MALLQFLLLLLTVCKSYGVTAPNDIASVNLTGHYSWELLLDIDNSNNTGIIRRQVETTTSIFCSYENMQKTIQSSTEAKSLGLDLGGTLFGIIKIGVKGEMSYEAKSVYENLSTTRREIRREIKKTDTYEVGPNSRLTLYRLVFTGPGINYVSSTLSSTPHKLEDVVISYNLEQKYFLKDIDVVYTRDSVSRPNNIITEVSGQNPDINAGFGGAYVWLVAQWTTKLEERATGIEIAIQRRANNNYKDLAKGAGGQFRYIIIQRDTHRSEVITNIALYRRRNSRDTPTSSGWMHMTGDINRRRRGDYLYLCWNTESF